MSSKNYSVNIVNLFYALEVFIKSYLDGEFPGMTLSHIAAVSAFLGGIVTEDLEFNKTVEMLLYNALKDVPELHDNFDFIFNEKPI